MHDHDASRQLVSLLRALTVELDLLGADFARSNRLHPTDVRALIALVEAERAGDALTPGRLAQHLGLDSSTVTALVDRMERLGHLQRQRDPADRRRVLLRLEDQAHELGWSFFGPLIGEAVTAMQAFDEAELATVDRFLRTMAEVVATIRATQDHRPPAAMPTPTKP
jgi:DNA-binding MarR family transcriptional regulator